MSFAHGPLRKKKSGTAAPLLITDIEVGHLLGCSRATVWRRVADGTLPAPVKIGGSSRFLHEEICRRVEQAAAARFSDCTIGGPTGEAA